MKLKASKTHYWKAKILVEERNIFSCTQYTMKNIVLYIEAKYFERDKKLNSSKRADCEGG